MRALGPGHPTREKYQQELAVWTSKYSRLYKLVGDGGPSVNKPMTAADRRHPV